MPRGRKKSAAVQVGPREKLNAKVTRIAGMLAKLTAPKWESAGIEAEMREAHDACMRAATQVLRLEDGWKPAARRAPKVLSADQIEKKRAKLVKLQEELEAAGALE